MSDSSIKVGVVTDQTGPLSMMGVANANVAKMVINDINAKGGLLGRQIDLYLEDSATTDSVAEAKAAKLVEQDKVDVILAASTARRGRRSSARRSSGARSSTSIRSSTRGRNAIRSSSAPARCRRSRLNLSFPG